MVEGPLARAIFLAKFELVGRAGDFLATDGQIIPTTSLTRHSKRLKSFQKDLVVKRLEVLLGEIIDWINERED